MKNYSTFRWRMVLVCSGLFTIFASMSLAAEPRPPSCLSTDGSAPEPGATCCDSTPTAYGDENGPLGNGTIINELLTNSGTFHSIGLVWDIDGDSDHDSSVSVRYRKVGACNFGSAMPLVRNDYAWSWRNEQAEEPANNLAGSLMFLTPGTTYEVVLELSDPDGGRAIRVRELTTRTIPRKPTTGRTLYVVPGSGGGDGSSGAPFRGLDAANAAAIPGDRIKLRDGTYRGTVRLDSSGAENNHIVYEPDDGASPVVEAIEIEGDHVWIDNLSFIRSTNEDALVVPWASVKLSPDNIIITNNSITGYKRSIYNKFSGDQWVVMDNTIVGDKPSGTSVNGTPGNSDSRGILVGPGSGHVVAYNSVTRVADGISSFENADVYSNQVFDVEDDLLEHDGATANVRVWGNRMHDAGGYGISFQPQYAGPWYFLYNQVANEVGYGLFKWRVQDRIVFVNNTFIGGSNPAHYFMRTITRNNLFIGNGPIWGGRGAGSDIQSPPQWLPSWNTDVDYDGFDWGANSGAAFGWFNMNEYYRDVQSFSDAVGVERNGRRVRRNLIFQNYAVFQDRSLTLNPSGNAVDAGAYLPNLADFYTGAAPDLGAHESGTAPLQFGPRNGAALHEYELPWAKH